MSNNPSLRQQILDLPVNGELHVSIDDYAMSTIHGYVSDLGFASGRTFKSTRDRVNRSYIVKRLA